MYIYTYIVTFTNTYIYICILYYTCTVWFSTGYMYCNNMSAPPVTIWAHFAPDPSLLYGEQKFFEGQNHQSNSSVINIDVKIYF